VQSKKVIREIENLKADTSKVIRDLTVLTSTLTSEANSGLSATAETLQDQTAEELKKIRKRLSELTTQLETGVKKADANIHANPYPWVFGALGFGVLFGAASRIKNYWK